MNWLKALRESKSITQEELAARLQVLGQEFSRTAIANWEANRHAPPLQDARFRAALAQALNVNAKTLLRAAGYEIESKHSEAAERAAAIIDTLPEDTQQMVLKIVEQLAEIAKTG